MFELGPRNADIDGLGAGLVQLSLRQGNIGVGGHSAREPGLGQLQVLLILLHGVVEQALLGIEAAQFEVISRQLRAQAQIDICQVSGCGLNGSLSAIPPPADVAPQIRFPGDLRPAEINRCRWSCCRAHTADGWCDWRSRVAEGPACTVGKYCER